MDRAPGDKTAQHNPSRLRHPYFWAVSMVGAAAGLQYVVAPYVRPTPFLMFFAAVMGANRYCGLGPGLVATWGSLVVAAIAFLPPAMTLRLESKDIVSLGLFAGICVFVSMLAEDLREAEHRARVASLALRRTNEDLERRVDERTRALAATVREFESFSYSVAHDLRAPLRAIDGFSRILEEVPPNAPPEEARRLTARIREGVRRMAALIDDLLRLSRISRLEVVPQRVDLAPVAREVVDELAHAHPERRVDVHVDPTVEVKGDPALLRIVLENLLSNAWKFTANAPAARVEVRHLAEPGWTGVEVRDNGAGFDPAHAPRMFEPFVRLHTHAEFEGTGIGLAICHRIVDRHAGEIVAEGRPGGGARFVVRLPA